MMNGIALSSSLLLAGGIIAFGFILSARGKSEIHNFDELDEKITTKKITDADSSSYSLQYKQADSAALVLFNPVIDTGPEGYGYERLGERYKTISPIDNIPDNPPPMIVFLGTADNIIDVQQAEDFCSAMKQDQDQCILKLYKDQKHGFFNYRNTRYFIQTVREADRFLIQQ